MPASSRSSDAPKNKTDPAENGSASGQATSSSKPESTTDIGSQRESVSKDSAGVDAGGEGVAKGGTYKLRDPETGEVRRTGRTNDLKRRKGEHGRHPETKDLDFEVDRRTDSYPAQRGREQRIYDEHPKADLNRKRPISDTNSRRDEYLEEGDKL